MMAMTPAPTPYPAAVRATAEVRPPEPVCSAADTWARALVVLSMGRPQAKMATNHQ